MCLQRKTQQSMKKWMTNLIVILTLNVNSKKEEKREAKGTKIVV